MNIPLVFGQALKRWRKARHLTQAELAAQTGYSLSTIRKLESGVLRPSRQVARRLSDVLQLS
ncbi:MAG: transcriptional regulator, partial [Chloroflexi bacterium]